MIDEKEQFESVSLLNERERILAEHYAAAMKKKGIPCDVDVDEDGSYFIFASVKGMESNSAFFYVTADEFEDTVSVEATYATGVFERPETDFVQTTDSEDPEIVAEFAADFIWHCFEKEHMQYCALEHITSDTIDRYIPYLPDFFFEDESKDYYAAGICLVDESAAHPAGAAVYSREGDELVIDYVIIDEDLRGLGLGTYLVNHILSTAKQMQ